VETRIFTRSQAVAERRHLSVMFCDLVNSTGLAEELDPEDLRDTVQAYQEVCSRVISRFEGSIAQYLGDGILAYFGYPLAHEDDARRAVKASLEIVRDVDELNRLLGRSGTSRLAVRIGIHTGLAVVGEVGAGAKRENLAVGQTPNVAARLQSLAEANGIVISEATEGLVRGFFHLESAGHHLLKGLTSEIEVFQVRGAGGDRQARLTRLTPFIARDDHLDRLKASWRQAELVHGQVVLLQAEAGLGKSRLVEAFKEELAGQRHGIWELSSSSYLQDSAFRPIIEALLGRLHRPGSSSPEDQRERLQELLAKTRMLQEDALPLLIRLLSLPPDPDNPLPALPPNVLRQRILETLVQLILRLADRRPLLLVAEDLHWMDPSTIELLGLLAQRGEKARLLLLLTFRPSFTSPWNDLPGLTEIHLERLEAEDARSLVQALPGGSELPEPAVASLIAKSDGNPLYLEELTKTLLETVSDQAEKQAGVSLDDLVRTLAVPNRLQDSLMARLDRLGPAKEVAQLGATLGRSFDLELLRAVSTLGSHALDESLERLVDADLLLPRKERAGASYQFRHAMLQEVAYQSLLHKQRRQYHWQVVRALEETFPATLENQPELLAHHSTEAQLFQKAIQYWQQAGHKATERFANQETLRHLDRGLQLLERYPESQEKDHSELHYRLLQAPALMATRGFVAQEVEKAYLRARQLSGSVADHALSRAAFRGLLRFHNARGEFEAVRSLAQDMVELSQADNDPGGTAEARWNLGAAYWHMGRPADALENLEPALRYFEQTENEAGSGLNAISPSVSCRLYCSYSLWFLGFPTRSLHKARENLETARRLEQPLNITVAQVAMAQVHLLRREPDEALAAAENGILLAQEHGIPHLRELAHVIKGSSLAVTGAAEIGVDLLRKGIAAWEASGLGFALPLFKTLLAEALGALDEKEDTLEPLAEALAAAENSGERYMEAEIHRLRGEALEEQGKPTEGKGALLQALDVARRQKARSLELRAATALARTDSAQHSELEILLETFTEGRETVDQQEAEAILSGELL